MERFVKTMQAYDDDDDADDEDNNNQKGTRWSACTSDKGQNPKIGQV